MSYGYKVYSRIANKKRLVSDPYPWNQINFCELTMMTDDDDDDDGNDDDTNNIWDVM